VRKLRLAGPDDADVLVEFNAAMARETEGKELLAEVVGAGVRNLLRKRDSGFYVVAEEGGKVIGALLVTKEWSDWRNGDFWWIQSVYVRSEWRRKGVYKALYRHVQSLAAQDPAVCGFRLYVERDNARAQETYRALGMTQTHYQVYEELKPGVKFYR
jgi:ribosomal protein S18 acetylase RimI-like enzyme